VGADVGLIGARDGEVEGDRLGLTVGRVGERVVGSLEGFNVGDLDGWPAIARVGAKVGALGRTGFAVGSNVG
jgi:hypothetical protein